MYVGYAIEAAARAEERHTDRVGTLARRGERPRRDGEVLRGEALQAATHCCLGHCVEERVGTHASSGERQHRVGEGR